MHEEYVYVDFEFTKTYDQLKDYIKKRFKELVNQGFNYEQIQTIIFKDNYFDNVFLMKKYGKKLHCI